MRGATTMSYTRRFTAAERKAWRERYDLPEPALGTLTERMGILHRRFGGRDRIVLTRAERAELARYREEDVA